MLTLYSDILLSFIFTNYFTLALINHLKKIIKYSTFADIVLNTANSRHQSFSQVSTHLYHHLLRDIHSGPMVSLPSHWGA